MHHQSFNEVRESDLLVHVVDISHADFEDHISVVRQTLHEIDANGKPTILLFNKIDAYSWVQKDEDDLTRVRIGGMNPYVVPLAGAPWAALLADSFIAIQMSWHFRIYRELELGFLADGLAMSDPRRIGDRELGMLGGLGLFIDFQMGSFQLDLRGGWTPSLRPSVAGNWNVFIAFGWQWSSLSS